MADIVKVRFEGDNSDLTAAFKDAGADAKRMATDIDQATGDTRRSFGNLEEGIDGSQTKFRGLSDTIEGSGDIMEGFRTGNLSQMAIGFADLAGGITDLVVPALKTFGGKLKDLLPAMADVTASSKGLVQVLGPVVGLAAVFTTVAIAADKVWQNFGFLDSGITSLSKTWQNLTRDVKNFIDMVKKIPSKIPGVGVIGDIAGGIGSLFHTGGVVPGPSGMNVPMILQAGETIVPRGSTTGGGGVTINVSGSVITERDLGRMVADALRNNRLIGVTA